MARVTVPLLSFIGAGLLLGESPTAQSIAGMLLIVDGIRLVVGLCSVSAQRGLRTSNLLTRLQARQTVVV